MQEKRPWLAALLNFVLPGTGYIYTGVRVRFGVLLIAAMALVLLGPNPEYARDVDAPTLVGDPSTIVVGIAGLMVSLGFAYDGYVDAKQHNENLE